MLTKTVIVGSADIREDRQIQIREDTVIIEDEKELSRSFLRYAIAPGDDVSTRPQFVKDLSAFLWTPEVVEAYLAKKATIPGV